MTRGATWLALEDGTGVNTRYTASPLVGYRLRSFGIPRSVYLVPVNGAALSAITPLVRYDGEYPMAPLTDATASGWTVNGRRPLTGGRAGARGLVTAVGDWTGATPVSAPIAVPLLAWLALSLALSVAPGGGSLCGGPMELQPL